MTLAEVEYVAETEEHDELPEGWALATLGRVALASKEKIEPGDRPTAPYLSLEHVESNTLKIIGRGVATDVKSTKSVFQAGDVLYGKLRPYLNKVAVPTFDGICSTDFIVFQQRPWLLSTYLMWFLSQAHVVEYAHHHSTGVSLPRVKLEDIARLEFTLPPLAEQRRIVAKVEELLSRVNAARERLARMPALLKRFRQSVLAAACSGRLTADWRGEDTPEDGELPGGWSTVHSGELFDFVTSGSRGWAKYYSDSGAIFLRVGNLDHDSIDLDMSDVQHVSPPAGAEGLRTAVRPGDILISITADVGMVALAPEGLGEAYVNQHVAIARPREELHRPYLAWLLTSPEGQSQFQQLHRGATKIGLGLEDIRSVQVPLPPLEEQREIVRRVDAVFALADAIESRVAVATARAERLTQSILAKAFRGQLVPTEAELARVEDRGYEPAAALLERIRSEREAAPVVAKRAGVGRRRR